MPGLAGVYVGPADLAISLGVDAVGATSNPEVLDAMVRIQSRRRRAGLVAGIHAGDGKTGKAMAELGFQMITLASESQALRRGAHREVAERRTRGHRRRAGRWAGTNDASVALVTGAARGQGAAHRQAVARRRFPVAACDLRTDELRAAVDELDDAGVIGDRARRHLRAAVGCGRRAEVVDRFGALEHAGEQRRRAAPGLAGRRDRRRLRKQLASQLSGTVPRHAGGAGAPARAEGAAIVNTCSTGSDPAVPEPLRPTARRSGRCAA